MKIEKKALFTCPSKQNILEAFRVTDPKQQVIDIVDSVGQRPNTKWIHIGTIEWENQSEMHLRGLCDVDFGPEHFSKFTAEYDTELKSGTINFAA